VSKRKRQSLGQAMGQAIVGFDYQVFRTTKPPAELVEEAAPIPEVAASDGGRISVDLPDLAAPNAPASEDSDVPDDVADDPR
jgi:hypothetical protein